MTCERLCSSTGVTNGADKAYPSGGPEFTTGFSEVLIARSCFADRCCPSADLFYFADLLEDIYFDSFMKR